MRKWITLIENDGNWRNDCRQLSAEAKAAGVTLDLDFGEDSILLIEISRYGSPKGAAAPFMERLCAIADANDLSIMLHVAGGYRALVSYYERFGFEIDEGGNEDEHAQADEDSFGFEVAMYREPRPHSHTSL